MSNRDCRHCASDQFDSCDSSTADEGACYPMSLTQSCARPSTDGICDVPTRELINGVWQWVLVPKLFAEGCVPITDQAGIQISTP